MDEASLGEERGREELPFVLHLDGDGFGQLGPEDPAHQGAECGLMRFPAVDLDFEFRDLRFRAELAANRGDRIAAEALRVYFLEGSPSVVFHQLQTTKNRIFSAKDF